MRVAVDAMGGDRGPAALVDGAVAAARHADVGVTLVGASVELGAELARHPDAARLDILVAHAADAVGMGERPAEALRRRPQSSIRVAADLVAGGAADALFSAGNTGATVLAARRGFGLLRGAERPALDTAGTLHDPNHGARQRVEFTPPRRERPSRSCRSGC